MNSRDQPYNHLPKNYGRDIQLGLLVILPLN